MNQKINTSSIGRSMNRMEWNGMEWNKMKHKTLLNACQQNLRGSMRA